MIDNISFDEIIVGDYAKLAIHNSFGFLIQSEVDGFLNQNPSTVFNVNVKILGKSWFDYRSNDKVFVAYESCDDQKNPDILEYFHHFSDQNKISIWIKSNYDLHIDRKFDWLDLSFDKLINKYCRWIPTEFILEIKKNRKAIHDDGCKCRVCKNFIFMAEPDLSINDNMMTCRSCKDNPMRSFY